MFKKQGLWAVLAFALMGYILFSQRGDVKASEEMKQQAIDIKQSIKEQKEVLHDATELIERHVFESNFYLRRICLNTAGQNAAAVAGCDNR